MCLEPKRVRSFYALRPYDRTDEDLIGREAFSTQWSVEVPLGSFGQVLRFPLDPKALPIHTVTVDIPAPKTRARTEWKNGAWMKYLAAKGWVYA